MRSERKEPNQTYKQYRDFVFRKRRYERNTEKASHKFIELVRGFSYENCYRKYRTLELNFLNIVFTPYEC